MSGWLWQGRSWAREKGASGVSGARTIQQACVFCGCFIPAEGGALRIHTLVATATWFSFVIFLFHLVYFQLSIPRLSLRNQGGKDLLPDVCLGRDAVAEPHPHRSQGESILSSSAVLPYLSPYSEHEGATFPLCFDRRKEEK